MSRFEVYKSVKPRGFNFRTNQFIKQIISKFVVGKMFIIPILNHRRLFLFEINFSGFITILWKSDIPGSIIGMSENLLLLVRIKSIEEGL